jgi:hypothetical protein
MEKPTVNPSNFPSELSASENANALPEISNLSEQERLCLDLLRAARRAGRRALLGLSAMPIAPDGFSAAARAVPAAPATITIQACADESVPPPELRCPPIRAFRWLGKVIEARFLCKAMSVNLAVAMLFGDFLPFDFIIVTPTRMYRVQVKGTQQTEGASWRIGLKRSNGKYRRGDFDFLAAMAPDGTWYIIPFSAIEGKGAIMLPRRKRQRPRKEKLAHYRERWDLFV